MTKPAPVGSDKWHWRTSEPVTSIPKPERDWVESFKAVIMRLVLNYRETDGISVFDPFRNAIEAERERYLRKGLDLATMQQIDRIADAAIARARRLGIVAFEPKEI